MELKLTDFAPDIDTYQFRSFLNWLFIGRLQGESKPTCEELHDEYIPLAQQAFEQAFKEWCKQEKERHKQLKKEYLDGIRKFCREITIPQVRLIHPKEAEDSWIVLAGKIPHSKRKNEKKPWRESAVRSSELERHLPEFMAEYYKYDLYISVNGFMGHGPVSPYSVAGRYLTDKCKEKVLYLNALYIDFDFYKHEAGKLLTNVQVVKIIEEAVALGKVPAPSLMGSSGRGAYAMWLLRGADGSVLRCHDSTRRYYEKVLNELQRVLRDHDERTYPDDNAKDAGRTLRLPGSINTLAPDRLAFYWQPADQIPTYTLDDVGAFLGVQRRPVQDYQPPKSRVPRRIMGRIALNQKRLSDALKIYKATGGFPQGKRRKLLTWTLRFARGMRMDREEMGILAGVMAGGCCPPYPSDESDAPVSDIVLRVMTEDKERKSQEQGKDGRVRAATLARAFGVTEEMARRLQLETILPESVRRARNEVPSERAQKQQTRRRVIVEMIEASGGEEPSVRGVRESLQFRGIRASLSTISSDLKAISGGWEENKDREKNLFLNTFPVPRQRPPNTQRKPNTPENGLMPWAVTGKIV